jgi:hypothetical protein
MESLQIRWREGARTHRDFDMKFACSLLKSESDALQTA